MRYHFMKCYDDIIKALNDEDLPCGPVLYGDKEKPHARLIAADRRRAARLVQHAPAGLDLVRVDQERPARPQPDPERQLQRPRHAQERGWTQVSYQTEEIAPRSGSTREGPTSRDSKKNDPEKKRRRNLVLEASPARSRTLDSLVPFVDHPVVAIRSPAVKVGARQVYRISVMVYIVNAANPGAGGLIVRDSIGGERLQFRTR